MSKLPHIVNRRFALVAGLMAFGLGSIASMPESRTELAVYPVQPEDDGRVATVIMHDGQVISGTLVEETETTVTLLINGIRTTIESRNIRESYIQAPIEERYKAVRETIEDDDSERLIQLARWLINNDRNGLAVAELEAVLLNEPFNDAARSLKTIAEQNLKLKQSRQSNKQGDEPADRPDRRPAIDLPDFPLLTEEEVNLIRVWEVDEKNPPKMIIERSTMEAVLKKYAGTPKVPETAAGRAAILSAEPAVQLKLLFDLQARDFYSEVQVLEDPESIRIFRDQVHRTWLRNSCATARCHGGTESGRLRLARAATTTPPLYYTNMVILERYRTNEGGPILNFTDPSESLLLKMGLPRRETSTPHPIARGWRPVFRSPQDRNYRRAAEWIDAMWTPRPDYNIDYDPPTAMELSAPTDDGGR